MQVTPQCRLKAHVDDLQGSDDNRIIEVVVLESDSDGIEQVSEILSERSDLAAIHFISHGADGQINLVDSWLNSTTLQQNSDAVSGWGNALTETGDILFYGCNIAADSDGQSLLNNIAELTGADVIASDDLTGSAALGGDWELEYTAGKVETNVAISQATQQTWSGVLSTYTVSSTADSGAGSLRQAIIDANANTGLDSIAFNIDTSDAGYVFYEDDGIDNSLTGAVAHTPTLADVDFNQGWYTIKPTSTLPAITDAVIIDGTTQAGYTDSPIIEINGTVASDGDPNGLTLQAGSSTIKGLIINRSWDDAIEVESNGGNTTIIGNYIGTDVSGTIALGNDYGLSIKSDNNVIGGTDPTERNIISGNINYGVAFYSSASNNTFQGNYIGTDMTGTNALGNSNEGIEIYDGACNNTIGGTTDGAGNIIAYNGYDGIYIRDINVTDNAILGNTIYSNSNLGINIGGGTEDASGVTANDTDDGDTGANALQNYPLISSVTTNGTDTVTVEGTLNSTASTTFRIEFFSNTTADGSSYGEAQTYLGFTTVTTDSSGNGSFSTSVSAAVAVGDYVTATATVDLGNSTYGNTSEFALNVSATAMPNQAPQATADSYILDENGTLTTTLGDNDLLKNDTDPDGDSLTVNTTPVFGPSHGSLTLNADGTFTYTPNANFADSDSFTYQVEDGNGGTDTATVTLTVTPDATNEAPVNAVPGSQITGKDVPLVFSGANGNQIIIRDDAGGNAVEVTLSAGNGIVTLADTTGLTITSGADGSNTITFTATLSDINTALNGLSFTPTADYTGSASLQIVTNDQGNTGTGDALSDSDTIAIDVVQVNQAPINTVPGAQTIDQNGMQLFSSSTGTAISINDLDAAGADVRVTLTATNGTINLSGNKGLSFSVGDGTNDTVQMFYRSFWASTALDVSSPSGAPGLDTWTSGEVLQFGNPNLAFEPGTTDGTFSSVFNLDTFAGATNVVIDAIHYVGRDILVGAVTPMQRPHLYEHEQPGRQRGRRVCLPPGYTGGL